MLGAIGASGALIAAALCALLIFSAVVAERGWPGVAPSLAPAPLLLPSGASPGATAFVPRVQVGSAPAPRGGPSRSSVRAVGGGSALGSARGGGRSVAGGPQRASTFGAAPPGTPGPRSGSGSRPAVDIASSLPSIPQANSPASPGGPSPGGQAPGGPPADSSGTPPSGPASSPLATVVDQTGRGAAGAVSSLSPAGAGAVSTIAQTVAAALPHVAVPLIPVLNIVVAREPVPAGHAARDPDAVGQATRHRDPGLEGQATARGGVDQPALVP